MLKQAASHDRVVQLHASTGLAMSAPGLKKRQMSLLVSLASGTSGARVQHAALRCLRQLLREPSPLEAVTWEECWGWVEQCQSAPTALNEFMTKRALSSAVLLCAAAFGKLDVILWKPKIRSNLVFSAKLTPF